MGTRDSDPGLQFRLHRGRAVAGIIVIISLCTLLPVSGWFALLLVPPVAWTSWVLRAGTDVDADGLRVRALFASRWLPWSRIESVRSESPDRVVAALTTGGQVPLTAVTAADLPRLAQLAPGASPV
ncbi:PH domain-containing protein [Natronosporangium hydrolyticum]|uniref:PH domain-containing protein n=1 Tax=Natronosporangium hydrolyticum TaxID=2811111 RepID=A0A895YHL0_9ACTN|nr:PH domain-containing protein [Natronosporangium hydrolyticum]QSB13640.1 PH domain-containing protein [Natronosporangium hydrolyticum]